MKKYYIRFLVLCSLIFNIGGTKAQPTMENTVPFHSKVTFTTTNFNHIRVNTLKKNYNKQHLDPLIWYYWYHKDTINRSQGTYSGKLLNGPYEEYFENWSPKTLGNFEHGMKTGVWKQWDHTGRLRKVSNWVKSKETGLFILFNEEGEILQKGKMKDGRLHGKITTYSQADSLTTTHKKFRNGVSLSKNKGLFKKMYDKITSNL